MKIFFTHTHCFKTFENRYFTTGGLTDSALLRYSEFSEVLHLGVRTSSATKKEVDNLSEITDKKVVFTSISYGFKMFSQIKDLVLKSDYVIARLPSVFGIIAVYFAKKYSKKVLVEVVGNGFDALWFHSWKGKILAYPLNIFTKRAIHKADYVSYITNQYLQKIYPTKGLIASGLSNITLNDDLFINDLVIKKRLLKINSNIPLTIGMIANYSIKYKGHKEALEVFSKLLKKNKNIKLQLVGGGNKSYLVDLITKLNISDNVILVGTIPNENIFEWLDEIDIYIQPSKTEAHGRSVIEAMSRGCTIITSDIGGMKETVSDDFRFSLNNLDEFLSILEIVVSNKTIREVQARINYFNSKQFLKSHIEESRRTFFKKIFI